MHSERKPPTTPICELGETCRVELAKENEAAAQIFRTVRGQCETRWNGEQDIEIDLNHLALWKAIEKYPESIKDEWAIFSKVLRVWHESKRRQRNREN